MRLGLERVLILAVSQIFGPTPELTRENESVRNCDIVAAIRVLQHRHQPPELDAVRMRLDFRRLRRKLDGRSLIDRFDPFGIHVMNRDVRVGDGRLFEILIDAAAPADASALPVRSSLACRC